MKQVGTIFKLGSIFTFDLIKAIKKDKSWALASSSKLEVDQLLVLLLCQMRTNCVGRNCWEEALKIINQH